MANIQPLLPANRRKQAHLGLVLLSLTFLGACAASEAQPAKSDAGKRKSVPVTVTAAVQKTLPVLVQGTGTVEAYSTVSVKSQIGGQLTGVYFQQGQTVKKGELLFRIDSRPLEAAVMEAEANRSKAIAAVTQAKANREKAISGVNQAQANQTKALAGVSQANANREKALAAVSQAKANLAKAVAGINQAKANQDKDAAQAQNTSDRADRYSSLYNEGAISKDQAEQYRTEARAGKASLNASQSGVVNAIAAAEAAKADITNAQADVKAADAAVENAQAAVKAADAEVNNAQAAVKAADADVGNAQAAVVATEAQIDNAKIQLSYSSIFSPIDGRTGSLKVNGGNLVKENDTNPLVVISQIHPIYVSFSIPQRMLPEVKRYMAQAGTLEVDALIPNDPGRPERGEITFVDTGVDVTTGTVQLKGVFANNSERLSPGQFVNVVLKLTEEPNAIAVPSVAVQTGQKGPFVYVVKPDNTAEMRPITVGNTVGNETVIKAGLKSGETVVTDGQFNIVPGAKVEVKHGLGKGEQTEKTGKKLGKTEE